MAETIGDWPKEDIPDKDLLYMRVPRTLIDGEGAVMPGAFRNHGEGMSTDWSEYATPDDTRKRGRKDPSEYGVIKMIVGDVRGIPSQVVEHTPDIKTNNRAHTDVYGEKNAEVRTLFSRKYNWSIRCQKE